MVNVTVGYKTATKCNKSNVLLYLTILLAPPSPGFKIRPGDDEKHLGLKASPPSKYEFL